MTIRQERTIESFSRGLELVKAIHKMWRANSQLPPGSNATINARIDCILQEFDLTVAEWHYWARLVAHREVPSRSRA